MRRKFAPGEVIFVQNGAPTDTSTSAQAFLSQELGHEGFGGMDTWPPSSPDLNPLDFSLWSILESRAFAKPAQSS